MSDAAAELARLDAPPDPRQRPERIGCWAVVTAVVASPASVTIEQLEGSTVAIDGVRHMAWYSPAVGDVVFCERIGEDLFVHGKLA